VSTLHVDPIACDGHRLCSELLPEWIDLDDWGYPVISPDPLPPGLEKLARRAVVTCPTLALKLRKTSPRAPLSTTR
jgi:ferredoxin